MKRLALLLVLLLTLGGCYGSYTATRKIHHWNGTITSNNIANSVVMWAMFIIPIYELGFLGDLFIFNTVESATGSNPIK